MLRDLYPLSGGVLLGVTACRCISLRPSPASGSASASASRSRLRQWNLFIVVVVGLQLRDLLGRLLEGFVYNQSVI